ncbi:MAG: DNA-3-methyladenine glycosylase family protein, partial [Solirubrobacteraceae bacterium]
MPGWSASIELRGAGGEPVDFARTLLSHGVAELPPNLIAPDGSSLETVLPADGHSWAVELVAPTPGAAVARALAGTPPAAARSQLTAQLRHMLRLDEDLGGFYAVAAADPALAWVTAGAGRMLRGPTVFEDVVKTICTTNCAWSGTVRMVTALVAELGPLAADASRRGFPTPAAMAAAGDGFYRDVARAGYRGAYLRTLATEVAEGRLDLEALDDPELPDDAAAELLLALPGVGPYATAHVMMLLGRY